MGPLSPQREKNPLCIHQQEEQKGPFGTLLLPTSREKADPGTHLDGVAAPSRCSIPTHVHLQKTLCLTTHER